MKSSAAIPVNPAPWQKGVQETRARSSSGAQFSDWQLIAFIAAHVPLAVMMRGSEMVSTLHAVTTFSLGIIFCFLRSQPQRLIYWAAYVAGTEVFWRMTDSHTPWEFGKLSVVFIFLLGMVTMPRRSTPILPIIYFALLTPALYFTFQYYELTDARKQISFNLSGPLSLAVCCCFMGSIKLRDLQPRLIFISAIAPIVAMATSIILAIVTATALKFTQNSNFTASGGFGPNQVSTVLSLGALSCILLLFLYKLSWRFKLVLVTICLWLASQGILTFSRTGTYLLIASTGVLSFFLFRSPKVRPRIIAVYGIVALAMPLAILPFLNRFTDDALNQRFSSSGLTGRDTILQDDLLIWHDHFFLGAGPGLSKEMRESYFRGVPAHTEFTRLLAEHGLFGIAATVIMFAMALQSIFRSRTSTAMAINACLVCWAFLSVAASSMRIVAPSFAVGLTFLFCRMGDPRKQDRTSSQTPRRLETRTTDLKPRQPNSPTPNAWDVAGILGDKVSDSGTTDQTRSEQHR